MVATITKSEISLLDANLATLSNAFEQKQFALGVVDGAFRIKKGSFGQAEKGLLDRDWKLFGKSISTFCAELGHITELFRKTFLKTTAPSIESYEPFFACSFFFPDSHAISITRKIHSIQTLYQIHGYFDSSLLTLKDQEVLERAETDRAMAYLQSRIMSPYPLDVIKKIIDEESLTESEKQIFSKWIDALSLPGRCVTASIFHKAILALVAHLLDISSPYSSKVREKAAFLAWHIKAAGCSLPQLDDRVMVSRINERKKQVTTLFENKVMYLFSDVKNETVLLFNNTLQLDLWQLKREKEAWLIEPLLCKTVNREEAICALEKFETTLVNVSWQSRDTIHSNDLALLQEITRFILMTVAESRMPDTLNLENIFVVKDQYGGFSLKVLQPLLKSEAVKASLKKREELLRLLSFDKACFYRFFVEKTKHLYQDEVARFFSVLRRDLLREFSIEPELSYLLVQEKIESKDMIESAKAMSFEFKKVKEKLYPLLQKKVDTSTEDGYKTASIALIDALLAFHKKVYSFSSISSHLLQTEVQMQIVHDALASIK